MPRTFNIRYRWTLDDFIVLSKRYQRLTRARSITHIAQFIFDLLLLAVAIYFAWIGERRLAAYCLPLFAFLLALVFVVAPLQRRRSFAHQRPGDFDIDFQADEKGFSSKSELAEGTHKWAAIRQVNDLPGHNLLWPSNSMGWMIPKRAFATPEDAAAFNALAKEKTHGHTL